MFLYYQFFFFLALCCRTFSDHCLVFCQTKWMAHKLRIILGLLGLSVEELHGNLTQLQVIIIIIILPLFIVFFLDYFLFFSFISSFFVVLFCRSVLRFHFPLPSFPFILVCVLGFFVL